MSHYREKGLLQASTLFNNKKIWTAEHKSFAYLFKIKSYCRVRCFGGINSSFESPFFCELYKVYIHIYTYIYIYIYIYNIYIYIYTPYNHIYNCIYLSVSIYLYICIICICMCVYIYIYIYKFTSKCHSQTTPSSEWRIRKKLRQIKTCSYKNLHIQILKQKW